MDKNVQCVLIKNDLILVAVVEEGVGDLGAPDCRLMKPFLLSESGEMT